MDSALRGDPWYDPSLKSLWKYDPKEAVAILKQADLGIPMATDTWIANGQPLKVEMKTVAALAGKGAHDSRHAA